MKLLLIILLLSGCITSQIQKLDPATYYRNDICFEYDTGNKIEIPNDEFGDGFGYPQYENKLLKFCGTGVLPHEDVYKLKIISYGKLNFFSLMTCHEEDTSENPDRGIFKKDGVVQIKYRPTLEKGLACPLYVSAYDRRQRHAFGIIAFEHPRYQLKAKVRCNGYTRIANGVSICQSRNGLIQEISFEEEVKAAKPITGGAERHGDCPIITSKDNKVFRFKLPLRECIYQFISKESRKIHKFYAIGYEDIIVRE